MEFNLEAVLNSRNNMLAVRLSNVEMTTLQDGECFVSSVLGRFQAVTIQLCQEV